MTRIEVKKIIADTPHLFDTMESYHTEKAVVAPTKPIPSHATDTLYSYKEDKPKVKETDVGLKQQQNLKKEEDPSWLYSVYQSIVEYFWGPTEVKKEGEKIAEKAEEEEEPQPLSGKPKLTSASKVDPEMQKCIEAMNNILNHLNELQREDDDLNKSGEMLKDIALLKRFIEAKMLQKASREEQDMLATDNIFMEHESLKRIRKQLELVFDRVLKDSKYAHFFGVANTAAEMTSLSLAVLALFFIASTVATGGWSALGVTALPKWLLLTEAGAAGAKAITGVAKGHSEYEMKKQQGEIFVLKHAREVSSTKIRKSVEQEMKQAIEEITNVYIDVNRILRNRHETTVSLIKSLKQSSVSAA